MRYLLWLIFGCLVWAGLILAIIWWDYQSMDEVQPPWNPNKVTYPCDDERFPAMLPHLYAGKCKK